LVDATAASDIDIAVTNLHDLPRAREERIDFTQPWFDAGLRIMVRADQGVDIRAVIAGLMDSGHFGAYALAWLLLYWVQLWRLRCLIGDLIRIFQSVGADGIAESFYTVDVGGNIRKACSSQEFDWLAWDVFGRAAWLMCGVAVLPISPLRLQAL